MSNLHEYEFNTELLHEGEGEGELVHELMAVSNEYELEGFLGKVWDVAKRVYNSPQGQAIKKDFITGAKSFGKKMFPSIGKNIGSYIGGPTGSQIGGHLGSAAGKWLFGEMPQQEAVDYVRVLRKVARYLNRALNAGVSIPPRTLVTQAINQAARPLIYRRRSGYTSDYSSKRGRWIRQGNKLIIQNV